MKNTILILFLCSSFISFSQDTIVINTSFNGRHCFGKQGLCDMTIPQKMGTDGNSKLYYTKGALNLIIDRDKLSKTEDYKVLGKTVDRLMYTEQTVYPLKYDLEINRNVIKGLHLLDKEYVIKKGNYPLLVSKEAYTITFKIE